MSLHTCECVHGWKVKTLCDEPAFEKVKDKGTHFWYCDWCVRVHHPEAKLPLYTKLDHK